MKKFYSFAITMLMAISAVAQTDVTYKITNPSFEENGTDGWTASDLSAQTNKFFEMTDGNVYLEKWVSKGSAVGAASIKQTVKNLVKGSYRLTVSAQNVQQGDLTTAQTGAYIYAKITTKQAVVTSAGDYTVDFDITTTSTPIGFVASNASGNWISVDNFRLTFLSTDAETVLALIETAKGQLEKKLNDANVANLQAAIDAAQKAVDENKEDLTGVAVALEDAYVEAVANTKAYTSLKTLISKAKLIVEKKMGKAESDALTKALAEAEEALETTNNDPVALTEALQTAYDNANTSVSLYSSWYKAIETAESTYDESKKGAAEYKEMIDKAKSMYEAGETSGEDITAQINEINTAKFAFNLANPTEGTGAAPNVSFTNTYVPTGSTEAMMRATFEGDNIMEKGVCWSKEHNPTVLDERTTKSFSLNGTVIHVKGLETGTVYYLRPYIINKTYQVAYGEEVKIVTHPKGTCKGTWDEGAPTDEANKRCRDAINETIEYFNQWTGIKGFTLSGHYGSGTPTADCSYGGWMRIGPKASYQAIGTVIHETGHGVGVGTHSRWSNKNVHSWKWFGREANKIYSFLENKDADPYNSDFCMVGDGTHGWGQSASYDWFVNGADKDKHSEFQYIGGCVLLYGLFIDGLCPTSSYSNGIAGYTYNFDSAKRYYIMNKDENSGLNTGLLRHMSTKIGWTPILESGDSISNDAAWLLEYDPSTGYYSFKNAESGKYISHNTSLTMKTIAEGKKPSTTEYFQLMPDRTDVTIGSTDEKLKTHGYWFTWNSSGDKAMSGDAYSENLKYGKTTIVDFNYADTATKQQWIILSEEELKQYWNVNVASGIHSINTNEINDFAPSTTSSIYSPNGTRLQQLQKGLNIVRHSDGSCEKIFTK